MLKVKQDIPSRIKDWLRPYLQPRHFHAFGIGMPKTGTHSLAAVFSHYRAWHEPEMERIMGFIMARANRELSDSAARDQLRQLERRMWLEFNASYTNYFLLDLLLDEYPQAKFVLTIRDCYSWVDSMFNQLLGRTTGEFQAQFHHWYIDTLAPGSHVDGDRVLKEHDLWPLDLWLRAWHMHNSRMISMVPKDRLLIVRTNDIQRDIPQMADFLGVPANTLDANRSHEYKADKKFGLVAQLDQSYLHERVAVQCGDLMRKFFPEIKIPSPDAAQVA